MFFLRFTAGFCRNSYQFRGNRRKKRTRKQKSRADGISPNDSFVLIPRSLLSRQWLCLPHACSHIESNKIAKITPQNALSSEDYWARSSYILRQRSTPKIYSTGSPKRRDFSINLNDARLSRLAQLKREPNKKTSEFNGTVSG